MIFGSLLVIGGLWWGTFNVVELIAHEERTERFTVPASELTGLLVDNDTGSVTIVGTDTDEINVEAEVSEGLRDTGFRQRGHRARRSSCMGRARRSDRCGAG